MGNKVVVIGGGLAGLSLAYHIQDQADVRLFEKEDRTGGLCRTEIKDGITFDYTGHFLHFRKPEIKDLVNKLTNNALVEHTRRSAIHLYGVETPYPFQINTYGHKPEVIKECLMGMIEAKYKEDHPEIESFADWILESCGEGVAKHFMFPYNSKIWTVHPKEMTTKWMGGYVPVPDIEKALDGALRAPDQTIGYNASFYYPNEGGIEVLPRAFTNHLNEGVVECQKTVTEIDAENKVVRFEDGSSCEYDHLVSTMPLKALFKVTKGLGEACYNHSEELRHNSVYTINLAVKRDKLNDNHWIYFPEDKYPFYRIGFPSQLSDKMAPEGISTISIEMSHSPWKPLNKDGLIDKVIAGLQDAKVLKQDDEIVFKDIMEIPCAYVIYDQMREKVHADLMSGLNEKQIYSIGRFGNWEYSAMEDAIYQGQQTAQRILETK